jgi:hypothetical protein
MGIRSTVKSLVKRSVSPLTFSHLGRLDARLAEIAQRLENLQTSVGRVENRQLAGLSSSRLSDYEYRVFSQWGEDGIIQFLLNRIPIEQKIFVEFGVQDYQEANTRFLLMHNNWTGLVLDSSQQAIERLKSDEICWRYALKAVEAFVTRENINRLIAENGLGDEIGLLSIDIDGNDYWVWEAIDVINPVIVIIEYNHRFGNELSVTVPYNENFVRGKQYPVIYFGASLKALCRLAQRKGYALVGCNSNGINAFFVRRDLLPTGLQTLTSEEGYVAGKFTETRDASGAFVHSSPEHERLLLLSYPLVEI